MKKMAIEKIVSINFRILLSVNNVTASEIAEVTGMSKTTLTSIYKGNFSMINTNTLKRIADYIGVDELVFFQPINPVYLSDKQDELL